MASHYICLLFDQYRWQCLPCKMDKQLTSPFFHCCSCYSARASLKGSLMENNNCFEWHVLLIFHLNSYRSFALLHVPSWAFRYRSAFDGCFATHFGRGENGFRCRIRTGKEKKNAKLKIDSG